MQKANNKIPEFTESLDVIAQLGDTPGVDDGLETQEFKKKFDIAGNRLKAFLNKYVVPAINNYIASSDGLLSLTGGRMKGILDMGAQKITNVASPAEDGDAVNLLTVNQKIKKVTDKVTGITSVIMENLSIAKEAWGTYSASGDVEKRLFADGYTFRAKLDIPNVKATMIPFVAADLSTIISADADIVNQYQCTEGGVLFYATAAPSEAVTILSVECRKVGV